MRLKKRICMFLVMLLLAGNMTVSVNATEIENENQNSIIMNPRATEQLDTSVPARTTVLFSRSFSLEAGESVTINASYSPFSASVDFGLVDSNGAYYYVNITDGDINQTLRIDERGTYRLQIRNHSSSTVQVSGFVNY